MKARVTTIGCEEEYGERRVVVEDEQIGDVAVRELEVSSLEELVELAEEVGRVEIESSNWDKYDFEATFICGSL